MQLSLVGALIALVATVVLPSDGASGYNDVMKKKANSGMKFINGLKKNANIASGMKFMGDLKKKASCTNGVKIMDDLKKKASSANGMKLMDELKKKTGFGSAAACSAMSKWLEEHVESDDPATNLEEARKAHFLTDGRAIVVKHWQNLANASGKKCDTQAYDALSFFSEAAPEATDNEAYHKFYRIIRVLAMDFVFECGKETTLVEMQQDALSRIDESVKESIDSVLSDDFIANYFVQAPRDELLHFKTSKHPDCCQTNANSNIVNALFEKWSNTKEITNDPRDLIETYLRQPCRSYKAGLKKFAKHVSAISNFKFENWAGLYQDQSIEFQNVVFKYEFCRAVLKKNEISLKKIERSLGQKISEAR